MQPSYIARTALLLTALIAILGGAAASSSDTVSFFVKSIVEHKCEASYPLAVLLDQAAPRVLVKGNRVAFTSSNVRALCVYPVSGAEAEPYYPARSTSFTLPETGCAIKCSAGLRSIELACSRDSVTFEPEAGASGASDLDPVYCPAFAAVQAAAAGRFKGSGVDS